MHLLIFYACNQKLPITATGKTWLVFKNTITRDREKGPHDRVVVKNLELQPILLV
jgi:hypothetical protein